LERYSKSQVGFLRRKHPMRTRFGTTDTPICPECNNNMRLTRRTPHPVRGNDFELQIFTCRICRHEIERDADLLGEVMA
jgi:hypothetical protein